MNEPESLSPHARSDKQTSTLIAALTLANTLIVVLAVALLIYSLVKTDQQFAAQNASFEAQIARGEAQVTAQNARFDALSTRVDSLFGEMADIKVDVSIIKERMKRLETNQREILSSP